MNPPQPIVASGRPWPSLLRSCLDQFGAEAAGANLGIVFLAIIFDRIAQSYGQRMQKSLKLEG